MGVTINDVARKAGVSHTTVSWVIHDDPRITGETKKKVMAAIRELDYHPNYMARSLVKGKTDTIAVLASFFSSPFEMEVLKGMEKVADSRLLRYNLNLYTTRDREHEVLMEILNGKRADAAILLNRKPDKEVQDRYARAGMPLILLDESVPGLLSVRLDNEKGAFQATRYLLEKGHRSIGIVMEKQSTEIDYCQEQRYRGFAGAMKEAGLPADESRILEIEDFYFEEGEALLRRIDEEKLDFDALLCAAGDIVAMGMISEARKRGIAIPGSLAIVGFDDIQAASLVSPALTTVRQPLSEMGARLLEETVNRLEGKGEVRDIIFEPELVIRESS